MATALSILAKPRAELAWVLEIEGCEVALTTTSDVAGIAIAWAASAWDAEADFHMGLQLPPSWSRDIDLLGYETRPISMTFRIVDVLKQSSTRNLAYLFADDASAATQTILTTSLDRDDTGNMTVLSSASFPASGTVWVGLERITYTSKPSGTTLAMAANTKDAGRGTYSPFTGKTNWSHDHKGTPTDGNGTGSVVSTRMRVWKNRAVSLYAVAKDPADGTWTTRANAVNVFVGYLTDGWQYDSQTGEWTVSADSLEKRLETQVLRDQFTATAGDGFRLTQSATLGITEQLWNNTTEYSNLGTTISVAAGTYTNASLMSTINTALLAETTAVRLTYLWAVSLTAENLTKLSVTTPAPGASALCNFRMTADNQGGPMCCSFLVCAPVRCSRSTSL